MVTGFYLIGAIGIQNAFLLGAVTNVLIGIGALVLARGVDDTATAAAPVVEPTTPVNRSWTPGHHVIATVVGASGLVALALEIVWFRTLVQYLAATTYAFTIMLATVLAGIALGAASPRGCCARRATGPGRW